MRLFKLVPLLLLMAFTEDFTGAAAALSGNWSQQRTIATGTVNKNGSGAGVASVNAVDVFAFWNSAPFSRDQYSQVRVAGGLTVNTNWAYCTVRATGTGDGAFNNYVFYTDGTTGAGHTSLARWVNGVATDILAIATTFTTNDVMRLEARGNKLYAYKNNVLVGTVVDSTLAIGAPGAGMFGNTVTIDDWEGFDLADAAVQQSLVDKPLTLLRCRPLGPGNPLRELRYEIDAAPVVSNSVTLLPDVGLLVLDGFAPTIGTPVTILPSVGALTLNGFAPSVGTPITIRPDFGQLTLTGFAPSIGTPVTLRPALGQLILTGFSPSIGTPVTLLPGLGQLTLSGFAPVIGTPITLRPGLGQLVLNGFAPSITVVAGGINMQPGVGALVLTGFAPTIGTPVTVRPGLGALLLSGFAPNVGTPVTLRPGLGQLVLAGFNPTLTLTSLTGTSDFTGELSVDARFTGDADIAPYFSGVLRSAAQFSGVVSIAARFAGVLLITPWFDGEEEVGPS